MFVGEQSNSASKFIQQGGRIDACGSDALTSVAGGYQGGSFGVVHRYPLQLTLQCFVKPACYQLASNHCPVASEACCYGSHSLPERVATQMFPACFTPTYVIRRSIGEW